MISVIYKSIFDIAFLVNPFMVMTVTEMDLSDLILAAILKTVIMNLIISAYTIMLIKIIKSNTKIMAQPKFMTHQFLNMFMARTILN